MAIQQERVEGNGSTIITDYGSRFSFGTFHRNGHPAHDRVVVRYNNSTIDVDATMLATILDGVIPGLSVTYTPPRLPDATIQMIDAARALIEDDYSSDYYRALVDLIHDTEPWPGTEGGDEKRSIIESLLRK